MTLQQLEYILAVNQFRHFAKAAEYCSGHTTHLERHDSKVGRRVGHKDFRPQCQQPVCPLLPSAFHIIELSPECVGSRPIV